MVKTYRTRKKTLLSALNEIEEFLDKLNLFEKEYPEYNHNIEIKRKKNEWEIFIRVIKDE